MGSPSAPAARPGRRRKNADARRDEIIRATTAVVADLGYADATLTEITQRAGISKGLLWHYFRDRDDLMRQAIDHLVARLRTDLVDGLDRAAPVPDVIRAVFTRTALFTRTNPHELAALDQIVHGLRAPDGSRRITMRDYEGVYAEHEALLSRGQREGTIRSGDTRILAVSYQALIDGLIGHLQAHRGDDPRARADEFADVFLRATARDPGHDDDADSR